MHRHIFLTAFFFTLTLNLQAAEKTKPAPAEKSSASGEPTKTRVEDFSAYKTADDLWKRIEELKVDPKVQPKSQAEMIAVVKEWFGGQRAAAEAFGKAYPKDERRYAAKLIALQAAMQLARVPGAEPATKTGADEAIKEIDAIIAAADAPADAKGEATFIRTMMKTEDLNPEKPESVAAFLKATDEFLAQYGTHKLAPQMRQMQLQVASQAKSPEADALLKKLAEGADPKLAEAAKGIVAQREKMASLKTKPLDLQFTAADGAEVDLAKLRGKVVLVDFWASWCGPCIVEMPNVVAAYKKLHEKGFEIVGISLDQDKGKMEAAMKKHGMTWAQYFDGKGWQNKISSGFGIESIPAVWLLDKKGMLRETELRGAALAANVEKLLAE